jgi:GNAT superfamily N-acetyltransferase
MTPLLAVHHEEVEESGWQEDPDWDQYEAMEENGGLLIHAAMDDDELVGYSVDIIFPSLHYKTKKVCVNDAIYIKPEYRGLSIYSMLLSKVEERLENLGVQSYTVHRKVGSPGNITMMGRDYKNTETVWQKALEN